MRTRALIELTSREVADYLRAGGDIAIIPVGSMEARAPHLPVGARVFTTEAFARIVAREVNGLVVPVVPISHAPHTGGRKGSALVPTSVLMRYVRAIMDELRLNGFRRILIVTWHDHLRYYLPQEFYEDTGLPAAGIHMGEELWGEAKGGLDEADLTAGACRILGREDLAERIAEEAKQEARSGRLTNQVGYSLAEDEWELIPRGRVDAEAGVELMGELARKLVPAIDALSEYASFLGARTVEPRGLKGCGSWEKIDNPPEPPPPLFAMRVPNSLADAFPGDLCDSPDAVLVPVGCVEQHGPHLLLGCDSFCTLGKCCEAARDPGVFVLPMTPVSWVGGTRAFPGGLNIRERVFLDYLVCVLRSLSRTGFRRIMVVNSHGGNFYALRALPGELYAEEGLRVMSVYGHGGCEEAKGLSSEAETMLGGLRLLGREDVIAAVERFTAAALKEFGGARPKLEPECAQASRKLGVVGHEYSHECLHVSPSRTTDIAKGVRFHELVGMHLGCLLEEMEGGWRR